MKNVAKDFQLKGAETQKAAVADRVAEAISKLRADITTGTAAGPFTVADVLRKANVTAKTLRQPYHSQSLKKVQQFLLDMDRVLGVIRRTEQKPTKHRSMRELMRALAQEAEATRLKLLAEISELNLRLEVSRRKRHSEGRPFRSIVEMKPETARRHATGTSCRQSGLQAKATNPQFTT